MTTRKTKTPADSRGYIAEIIGDESLYGQRMFAGVLLHMMDFAAAQAAIRHTESTLVTLAFDRVELLDFVFHRDYVRYDACVIKVGKSSVMVKVDASIKSPTEMTVRKGHSGIITMVAIDDKGRPNWNIPALDYETPEDLKMKKIAEQRDCQVEIRRKMLADIENLDKIDAHDLKDRFPRDHYYPSSETVLTIRKVFLPRNANALGIVFGGDTIQLMEELARATARQFTGNFRMVTIAMEDVLFLHPLYVREIVEMSGQVIFVAETTLMVEITVKSIPLFYREKAKVTNKGTFTVLNLDGDGRKMPIRKGIDLKKASSYIKKCYLKEQIQYENRKGNSESPRYSC